MADLPKRSLEHQIAEVGREIGLRRNVYPAFIARAKMTKEEADEHMARMEAVLRTLTFIKQHEAAIRRVVSTDL